MPLTSNGKLIEKHQIDRNGWEKDCIFENSNILAKILEKHSKKISVTDNFFDMGGRCETTRLWQYSRGTL